MPKLTGKLKTITEYPSAVREVLLRAPRTRTAGKAVIVDEPVRIIVDEHGEFTADTAPGAAVLVLVGADFMARESIPLLVAEGMTTIAEAMEAAVDFTPEVHDRLAELAADVARGVKSTGEAALAAADDREKAEKSAAAAKESAAEAAQKESSASSAWQQMKASLEAWEPKLQQLKKWQPQYEWLKENAGTSFAVVQEKITQATRSLVTEVKGDAEAAKRDAATAGQHSLKAQAAAKSAENTVQRVVDAAIATLKGNAPEMLDTLEELAERVKSGGKLENEIIQKLSKMADSDTVRQLKSRLDSLNIGAVKGLSGALAGKANSTHTHNMSDVIGLENLANSHARMETRVSSIHREVSQKADKNGIADIITEVIGINKIEVVDRKPYQPQQGTLYLIRE